MTERVEPLTAEEIQDWLTVPKQPDGNVIVFHASWWRLLSIAEDHARLHAENAKLRERVGKLERTCASAARAVGLASTAVHSPDQQDFARWCAARDVFCAHFAALAALDEEPTP